MTRVYSLAHHLKDEAGHQYRYHLCLQKALEKQGIDCHVYIDRYAKIPYLHEGWLPFFHPSNRWLGHNFRNLLKKSKEKQRIFFLECFSLLELFHFFLAFCLFGQTDDKLCLLLRRDLAQQKCKGIFHLLCLRMIQKKLRSQLKLFTDSSLLKEEFEGQLQQAVQYLPIPHVDEELCKGSIAESTIIRCYWPGSPKQAKGWDAMRAILHFAPSKDHSIELTVSSQARLSSTIHAIREIAPILSHETYWEELARCNLVLLPYDPTTYRFSTSGIFIESICAGKIPIVKDGSWLAYELRRFDLEMLIIDWEDPLFWTRLSAIVQNKSLQQKLQTMQLSYRSFHKLSHFGDVLGKSLL
jgi:hypothetical protein